MDLGETYSCICDQLRIWLGDGRSRMILARITWLCSVWFLILQQASQGCSHTDERVPSIDTKRGRKLNPFTSNLL